MTTPPIWGRADLGRGHAVDRRAGQHVKDEGQAAAQHVRDDVS